MKMQRQSDRKARTRQLITAGDLFHKSGLMEAFSIALGDDLQDYKNRKKAAQLLGFLTECFQESIFDDTNLVKWRSVGERLIQGSCMYCVTSLQT